MKISPLLLFFCGFFMVFLLSLGGAGGVSIDFLVFDKYPRGVRFKKISKNRKFQNFGAKTFEPSPIAY
jgi:hypothetical protein